MVPFLLPFYWMIRTSLMSLGDATSIPPKLLFNPTLQNYARLLSAPSYWKSFTNRAIIGGVAMAIGLAAGLPAAYSIAAFARDAYRRPSCSHVCARTSGYWYPGSSSSRS